MKKILLLLMVCSFFKEVTSATIGVCIMATGPYISYIPELLRTARKYFCVNHHVTYFIFTDGILKDTGSDVVVLYQKRLGWPYDTLKRFEVYAAHHNIFQACEYVFALDADMKFEGGVGDEILSKKDTSEIFLVGTMHPGIWNIKGYRGEYDQNQHSYAYVRNNEGTVYFAGGFYGGRRKDFLDLITTLAQAVTHDLTRNYIARWHDESYLNRYFIDHEPLILSPSYCYPETVTRYFPSSLLKLPRKIIARDKNHKTMQV